MTVADEDGSQYTEQELAIILQRAARLSEGSESSPRRYTLEEIEEIAVQAGIDAGAVRRSAADLSLRHERAGIWGAGTRFRNVRRTRGEVPDSQLPHLVNAIESETGLDGVAEQIAGGLAWRARDSGGLFTMTITSGGGFTEIVATAERDGDARLAIAAAFSGSLLGAYVVGAALSRVLSTDAVAMIVLVAFPVAFVAAARALRFRVARRWERACKNAVDALIHRITSDHEA